MSEQVKVLSVFGTRPEAIKMAPVLKQLDAYATRVLSRVCITGQHRQMLDQILEVFKIVPHYDLRVMRENQSPTQVAAEVMRHLEPVLKSERPDWVLVQGDTTSAMAAALTGFYAGVRVAHIEAGLRTHDMYRPFPEEINRRIVSVVASLHFAPTQRAKQNLLREGIPEHIIYVTGNPVIDALLMAADMPYDLDSNHFRDIPWDRKILLVTAHRRESFGPPMKRIVAALKQIAFRYSQEVHIIFPVHPNPQVQHIVRASLDSVPGITLTDPLDYLAMVHLMKRSYLILTDSGGIQEEAPSLGKPVLVLRDVTERPEAIEAGTSRLVGTECDEIVRWTARLLEDPVEYARMANAVNPYGDGHAAERIVEVLLRC